MQTYMIGQMKNFSRNLQEKNMKDQARSEKDFSQNNCRIKGKPGKEPAAPSVSYGLTACLAITSTDSGC